MLFIVTKKPFKSTETPTFTVIKKPNKFRAETIKSEFLLSSSLRVFLLCLLKNKKNFHLKNILKSPSENRGSVDDFLFDEYISIYLDLDRSIDRYLSIFISHCIILISKKALLGSGCLLLGLLISIWIKLHLTAGLVYSFLQAAVSEQKISVCTPLSPASRLTRGGATSCRDSHVSKL